MNSALKKLANGPSESDEDPPTEEEWNGVAEPEPEDVTHEDEYMDGDRQTTVTVEEVDITKQGLQKKVAQESESSEVEDSEAEVDHEGAQKDEPTKPPTKQKRVWTKEKPSGSKRKKKKFRYETKAERKLTRMKERSGNKAKAKARRQGNE